MDPLVFVLVAGAAVLHVTWNVLLKTAGDPLLAAAIGLATAAHQAFSANLYTLPSDLFPRGAVGSVIGIGGTVGALGGMGMALLTGYILDATHNYSVLFAICASAYIVALLVVHVLSPRLAPVGREIQQAPG